ncbi:(2Fe-2S)-binding protein [Rhizobium sp. L1K21]|uniref:(2Fe-2S)-binding protein n=1 Tax=Rhizobium sp. L1K21 TaxID=2954933 RepID=UPI002092D87D|nr:(2Fe-2S)-binding protein [Rhizobium sp. L1K21]MCO6188276.1 (2Fe-2S)-binding protein [Rhizobium sp. L1K21]
MAREFEIQVNGKASRVHAEPDTPLLYILRNDLQLNGPKYGCGLAQCGACAVLANGKPVRACMVPLEAVGKTEITTLEGLGSPQNPNPVQAAFVKHNAAQCGYCINGMIIAVTGLLNTNPNPSDDDIKQALRHHLCRCGTHMEILAAAREAADMMAGASPLSSPLGEKVAEGRMRGSPSGVENRDFHD